MSDESDKEIYKAIGRLEARQDSLEQQFLKRGEDLNERLDKIEEGIQDLRSYANKWKGGFWVLLGLGSAATWLLSQWENIVHFFSIK